MPANFFWVKCVRFLPFHDHDCPSELPRFSVNFREPSGPYQKRPKMFWWPLSTFKTGVKDTNFSVFWFSWNRKSSFKAWNSNCGNWIKRLSLITYLRTICLDLWARLEKLSLKYSQLSWQAIKALNQHLPHVCQINQLHLLLRYHQVMSPTSMFLCLFLLQLLLFLQTSDCLNIPSMWQIW